MVHPLQTEGVSRTIAAVTRHASVGRRIRRKGDEFLTEDLGGVRFVPLVGGLPRETMRQR